MTERVEEAIRSRYRAGETAEELAADYGMLVEEIEEVVMSEPTGIQRYDRDDSTDDIGMDGVADGRYVLHADHVREREELQKERDHLKVQAESHAQEARTQRATVHEIYQILSDGKGESGDWNGVEPVRKVLQQLATAQAERDRAEAIVRTLCAQFGVHHPDMILAKYWKAQAAVWEEAAKAYRQYKEGYGGPIQVPFATYCEQQAQQAREEE